jgi:hypothetical protein
MFVNGLWKTRSCLAAVASRREDTGLQRRRAGRRARLHNQGRHAPSPDSATGDACGAVTSPQTEKPLSLCNDSFNETA